MRDSCAPEEEQREKGGEKGGERGGGVDGDKEGKIYWNAMESSCFCRIVR